MRYSTYMFYKIEYYGESLDESSFDKWIARASDKLNYLCCGNITDAALEMYSDPIQKATCALADLMYELDEAAKTASAKDESNVKSKSSGSESVTYGDRDTMITKVLSDKKAQNRLMYDTIAEHLSGTGLLYAGY